MRILLLITCVCMVACQSTLNKSEEDMDTTRTAAGMDYDSGWITLFDGQSFSGWHTYGKDSVGSAWKIDSGAIHLDAASKAGYQSHGGGDLVTNESFSDFHLMLDWKISPNGNSGILIYVQEDTSKYKETYFTGPEMQVLDAGHSDASIYKHKAGDLYDLIASSKEMQKPAGEWNHVEIISNDGKLDFFLNGENIVSTIMWDDAWKQMIAESKFKEWSDFGTAKEGHIALQDHGNDVWFKDIKIKRL